jgi:hypothetical protein
LKGILVLLAATLLSGCTVFVRTESVPHDSAEPAPAERVLGYQEHKDDYVPLIITRDVGFMGGGCYIGVVIEGTLVARLDPGETATFYVRPGETNMAAVPDPQARGLCAAGWDPVLEHYVLKSDRPNLYRVSLGAYRRPRLTPAAY